MKIPEFLGVRSFSSDRIHSLEQGFDEIDDIESPILKDEKTQKKKEREMDSGYRVRNNSHASNERTIQKNDSLHKVVDDEESWFLEKEEEKVENEIKGGKEKEEECKEEEKEEDEEESEMKEEEVTKIMDKILKDDDDDLDIEVEMKLTTEKELIELGEEIAKRKMQDEREEKIRKDIYERMETVLLKKEEMEKFKEDRNMDLLMESRKEEWEKLGYREGIKWNKSKESFLYMTILIGLLEEKNKEMVKELSNMRENMDDLNNMMDQYVEDLDEMDKENKKLINEKKGYKYLCGMYENQIESMHFANHIDYIGILIISNLINFVFTSYGIKNTCCVMMNVSYTVVVNMGMVFYTGFYGLFYMMGFLFHERVIHLFMIICSCIQIFQMGKWILFSMKNRNLWKVKNE